MKIKCIEPYYDMQLKKNIEKDEVLEVDETRAKELTSKNNKAGRILAILVEDATTPTTEKMVKPKKRAKKEV